MAEKNLEDYEKVFQEMDKAYKDAFDKLGLHDEYEKYEKSNQFLHEALESENRDEALKLVKLALKYDSDNFDAKIFKVTLEEDSSAKQLAKFDKLIAEEEKLLRDTDCFEYEGDFWLEVETRPYMRALAHKMTILVEMDRFRDAIAVGERMIELNTCDNMGVRYQLLPLYAMLEETQKAEELKKKFKVDKSVGILLPMAVCYYRAGMYSKCDKAIAGMYEFNPNARTLINSDNIVKSEANDYYSPGEPSEVFSALENNRDLLMATFSFLDYLEEYQNKELLKNVKTKK